MAFTSSLNFKETLTQEASGSLTLLGSGSTGRTDLFTVNGNNGTLFSVSDDLSNSLFSVNTIAGLPVIEAFANNTVVMGTYGQNVLVVTGSNVGIGTATPTRLLDVNGSVSFNGEKTLYNPSYLSLYVGEDTISGLAMSYNLFPGTTSAIIKDTLDLSSNRLAKGTIIYIDKYRETVVRGQLVVLDQATDGWKLALATTSRCTCLLGIALKDGNNGDPATVLIEGLVTTSYTGEISTLQRGTPLFISATTAGQTIDPAPSTAGQFVRGVGWIAGTDGSGMTIFFQPDISWKVV